MNVEWTNDWEQRKLGEFGKATGGTSIESEFVEEGNYKVISIGSYSETSKYNDQGLRTNKTSKTESKILNKDDLTMILNDKTAAGNIIGRVLLVDADNSYVYNQRTERIEVYKKEFEPSFLYQLLNAENIRSKIIKASQGNTQIYVNWSTISELKYPIPRVKSEQKKIATFFNNLDNLITLHQWKCYFYEIIRLNDWEQRKLLDCIQKITDFRGRTPKKLGMNWSESGYLALSALNVKDGYIDFLQDVHYGDQALYDKWMTGNELHKGQVLFTTEAPMGNVAQIPDNRRYILSQRTIAFDVKPELIIENFLAIVLRTPTVFASLTALSSGGTAKGVSQKSLATVEITIPVNLNEQEQLASIFSIIDHLITLHQRKYILYKNIKSDTEKQRKLCESEEKPKAKTLILA